MIKSLAKVCLLTIVTLSCVFSARAWDDTGHKITAYIAWQQMRPAVREQVIKTLLAAPEDAQLSTFYLPYTAQSDDTKKREFFMLAATWPDIIRDRLFETRYKKYHHSNWHYSDTFWTVKDGKIELLNMANESGKALDEMIEFDKLERDPQADAAQKALGIAWLEHLIGDIHQPLHASARVTDLEPKGDQGANLFLLSPKGAARADELNLHWFWDSIIGRNLPNSDDKCDADYIDPIAKDIMKKYPYAKMQGQLNAGNFEAWKKESFEVASTQLFPADLKRNEMPSDKYKKNALKIAEERLALAGYRMGDLFNSIFGKTTP
jgi:S1/P1 Nuclease.